MAETNVITVEKITHWLKHKKNVLIKGRHGTGKTSLVLESFKDGLGLQDGEWLYFSGATLDPWVDFIGVPKEVKDPHTGVVSLDIVRPKCFSEDKVRFIFIDEWNRSPKKVRNATLELIQFKSINGKKFNNLEAIIAAVNPDDDIDGTMEYDVEKADPAQLDRFQIHVEMEYKPSISYFTKKYEEKMARAACEWWSKLPKEQQKLVSPRRLDYALECYLADISLDDVLPESCGISVLREKLHKTPSIVHLANLFKSKDKEASRTWLKDNNNFLYVEKEITKNAEYRKFFLPLLTYERISELYCREKDVRTYILDVYKDEKIFIDILLEIKNAGTRKELSDEIDRQFKKDKFVDPVVFSKNTPLNENKDKSYTSTLENDGSLNAKVLNFIEKHDNIESKADQRLKDYNEVLSFIPKVINQTEAINIIKLLNVVVKRTAIKAVSKYSSFIPVLNLAIESLHILDYDLSLISGKDYAEVLEYAKASGKFYFRV